jgi:hypothetical protein
MCAWNALEIRFSMEWNTGNPSIPVGQALPRAGFEIAGFEITVCDLKESRTAFCSCGLQEQKGGATRREKDLRL